MLAHIVSLMKNIVIAGSHGKTTTTSLVSKIFIKAKIDPTIINGGVLNSFGNSAKLGKSNWCILESDESDGSFIKVPQTYSVITNIDREHLDFYKSMNNLENKFISFIEKTPSFGKTFICVDDKNNRKILKKIKNNNYYTYGTKIGSNFQILNISQGTTFSKFDLKIKVPGISDKIIKNVKVPTIGMHNIRNATAAVAVSLSVGISENIIKKALYEFEGVQRRFTKIFTYNNVNFYDDYAHHPTEIKEVINGVSKVFREKKIVCIFQPHRVSRLKTLRKDFSSAFKKVDTVVLCPVYKAGENIKLGFKYKNFAKEIIRNSKVKIILINNEIDLARFTKQYIFGEKLVVGMGAGSISSWLRSLPKLL